MAKIDCQVIREEILQHVRDELEKIDYETELAPSLAIITIGDDDASKVYVRNKINTAESLGIQTHHIRLASTVSQEQAEQEIKRVCETVVDAVMLQLPVPKHLDSHKSRQVSRLLFMTVGFYQGFGIACQSDECFSFVIREVQVVFFGILFQLFLISGKALDEGIALVYLVRYSVYGQCKLFFGHKCTETGIVPDFFHSCYTFQL